MYQLSGIDGEKIAEKRELSSNNFAMKKKYGMFYIHAMILKFQLILLILA